MSRKNYLQGIVSNATLSCLSFRLATCECLFTPPLNAQLASFHLSLPPSPLTGTAYSLSSLVPPGCKQPINQRGDSALRKECGRERTCVFIYLVTSTTYPSINRTHAPLRSMYDSNSFSVHFGPVHASFSSISCASLWP